MFLKSYKFIFYWLTDCFPYIVNLFLFLWQFWSWNEYSIWKKKNIQYLDYWERKLLYRMSYKQSVMINIFLCIDLFELSSRSVCIIEYGLVIVVVSCLKWLLSQQSVTAERRESSEIVFWICKIFSDSHRLY